MSTTDKSLLQSILSLLDVLSSHKTEGQSWIHLLSLLCIFTILNQPTTNTASPQPANPLQKLLGDLTKGSAQGGGIGGTDTLLSLLPLLNNPQIKSKLNPANITAMMNMVQNLAQGTVTPSAKTSASSPEIQSPPTAPPPQSPPASQPISSAPPPSPKSEPAPTNRYLDWKSSF